VKAKFVDINHDKGTIYAAQFIFRGTAKYMYKNTPFFLMLPSTVRHLIFNTTSNNPVQCHLLVTKAKYIDQSVSHNHATLYSHFILETKLKKI